MQLPRWLRALGLGVWLIAGASSYSRVAREPRAGFVWLGAFALFGVLLWIGSDLRASRGRRVACLLCEVALGALVDRLGLPAFEGAPFALVAAQLPLTFPLWASATWSVLQLAVLAFVLPREYNGIEIAKSLGGYFGFAILALALVRMFDSERRARVEVARAGERVRIARELHDVLGHHLAALTIHLDLARRKSEGAARESLEEAYGIAQSMLKDVRATVTTLRKDEYDLRGALEAVVQAVPEPAVELAFPDGLVVRDVACAHVALRCVQEAITNAVKHARAKRIVVALSREDSELMIRVEDDGAGAAEIHPGSGLSGMRERIEELGGSLEVESVAGRGTTVRARLPLGAP